MQPCAPVTGEKSIKKDGTQQPRHDCNWGDGQSSDQNVAYLIEEGGSRTVKTYQGFYDVKLDQKLDFMTKGRSVQGALS